MADKPLYYGSNKNTPMYYGGSAKGPMYYGAGRQYGAYGSYGSYGAYGAYGSYGGGQQGGEGESFIGTITIGRMLRVISQRWLSVFVFILVGLIVSFAIYKISPTIYEASSEFTMDTRRATGRTASALDQAMLDLGTSYAEIFNTRLSIWRSEKIVAKIVEAYRTSYPASVVTEEEITAALAGSKLELQRNSRNITITVRSKSPSLAMALANAYASAIESLTDEENKARCDKRVSQLHDRVESKRRDVEELAKQMVDSRTTNRIDHLKSRIDMLQQTLAKLTTDINDLEAETTKLAEWERMLKSVKEDPESFGALSSSIPNAQDIATDYRAYIDATNEYAKLMLTYTDSHPDVIAKRMEIENAKERFVEVAARALESGHASLQEARNRLSTLKLKRDDMNAQLAAASQEFNHAESKLSIIAKVHDVESEVLKSLKLSESQARGEAEANNEIITLGRKATEPKIPVLPNPMFIFGAGIGVSLALGLLFVLVMDNLEDTVVNLADIEGRLALKVLAVLPHVRRKNREQVAKFAVEEKYSQFSEAIAGFRNLLDSPRYEAMSHCMLVISTQPGEGKTITSTSIAISYAQSGRKVLHVDFDLRRPRLARIWGVELTKERSFSHALQNAASVKPDFAKLVNKTSVEGLDVVCSLPPDGVSPSTIFGSSVIADFFAWARANYDRVIVDSPPYGVVGDVVSLSVLVDSVIIMCCPDRTHFKPIQYCSRSLTEAGANILGVIVNDVEIASASAFSPTSHRSYRYGYGYGYGYGYRPETKSEDEASGEDGVPAAPAIVENEEFTDDE